MGEIQAAYDAHEKRPTAPAPLTEVHRCGQGNRNAAAQARFVGKEPIPVLCSNEQGTQHDEDANSTLTVAVYIYKVAFQDFKMGKASAITVVLFAIILLITIFQLRVLRRRVDY